MIWVPLHQSFLTGLTVYYGNCSRLAHSLSQTDFFFNGASFHWITRSRLTNSNVYQTWSSSNRKPKICSRLASVCLIPTRTTSSLVSTHLIYLIHSNFHKLGLAFCLAPLFSFSSGLCFDARFPMQEHSFAIRIFW